MPLEINAGFLWSWWGKNVSIRALLIHFIGSKLGTFLPRFFSARRIPGRSGYMHYVAWFLVRKVYKQQNPSGPLFPFWILVPEANLIYSNFKASRATLAICRVYWMIKPISNLLKWFFNSRSPPIEWEIFSIASTSDPKRHSKRNHPTSCSFFDLTIPILLHHSSRRGSQGTLRGKWKKLTWKNWFANPALNFGWQAEWALVCSGGNLNIIKEIDPRKRDFRSKYFGFHSLVD